MKKFIYLLVFVVASATVFAQGNEVVYVKSVRFATPLLEKWIAEYAKVNPDLQIVIAGKDVQPEKIGASLLVSDEYPGGLQTVSASFAIGRYAILPVAGKNNAFLASLKKKKLNAKRIKELFFEKDFLEEEGAAEKGSVQATIYSGNTPSSISGSFAGHFDRKISDLKGKRISGDDIYLLQAIRDDNTGISFNNLTYIYDVDSRRLKEDIAILPLDLKKEDNEILEDSDLDKVIGLLERKTIDVIPVEKLSFALQDHAKPEIQGFLQWILSDGQTFNHQFGFLQIDEKTLKQQSAAFSFLSKK